MRYQIFRRKGDNQLYFHFKTNDGKVILTSQFYQAKTDCDNGIRSVIKNAPEDARYDRQKDKDGKHFFTLKAGNGQEIGKSVVFDSDKEMESAITLLKKMKFKPAAKKEESKTADAAKAAVAGGGGDFKSGTVNGLSYKSWQSEKNQEYYFNFTNKAGKVILKSEGYTTKASCDNGIESVLKNANDPKRYERKVSKNGKHFFDLKAGNGQVIGTSALFDSEADMNAAMSGFLGGDASAVGVSKDAKADAGKASIATGLSSAGGDKKEEKDDKKKEKKEQAERTYLDNGKYPNNNITWETFQSGGNEKFYFVFKGSDDKVILINGDVRGYATKADLDQGVQDVIKFAPDIKNYEYKTTKTGKHYFYIKNAKDSNVARGSLFFDTEESMQATIKLLLGSGAATAAVAGGGAKKEDSKGTGVDEYLPVGEYKTTPGFASFTHSNGEHYFSYNNEDGKVLLRSEGYSSESSRDNGIKSVTKNAPLSERYVLGKDEEGHYFALKAGNHQEIARSVGYADKAACEADMAWVQGEKSRIGVGSKLVGGTLMSAWMISSSAKGGDADAKAKAAAGDAGKAKAEADAKAAAAKSKSEADAKAIADARKKEEEARLKAIDDAKKKAAADAAASKSSKTTQSTETSGISSSSKTTTTSTTSKIVAGAGAAKIVASAGGDKKESDDYMACNNYIGGKPGFVHFKIERTGYSYFNYNDDKGKVLLVSQGYQSDTARDNGVESVTKNAPLEERWSTFKGDDGKWYYSLKAGNHQEIAKSCAFDKEADMKAAYAWLRGEHSTLGKGAQFAGGVWMSAFAYSAWSKKKETEANALRLKAEADAKVKAEAEAKATRIRIEAEAKKKAEEEAKALKIKQEAEAKALKLKQEAEAKAKAEADAKALKLKAEADAAAKKKAAAAAAAAAALALAAKKKEEKVEVVKEVVKHVEKKKVRTDDDYLTCKAYQGHKITDTRNNVAFFKKDNQHYFVLYNKDKSVKLRSEGFENTKERDSELAEVLKFHNDKSMYSEIKKNDYRIRVLKDKTGREVGRSCMEKIKKAAPVKAAATPVVKKEKIVKKEPVKVVKEVVKEKPLVAAAPVAAAAGKSGCAWWYFLPLLLLIPLIWFGMKGCGKTAPVKPAVVAPVEKPPVVEEKVVKETPPPAAPKGCTANCTGSKNKIFNIPSGRTPKTLTRLGTNPEFGNSHGLSPEQFYNKLKKQHSTNNTDKRFLDNLFNAMGYKGFGEVTAAAFSATRIAPGTIGNIGASKQHRTVYAKLNTSGKDLEAFRIKGKNGCDIHFMKTCGNHFFYCPNN